MKSVAAPRKSDNLGTAGTALLRFAAVLLWMHALLQAAPAASLEPSSRFDPEDPAKSGYELTFDEHFVGNRLDLAAWNTAYPWGPGTVINHELQHYADISDPNNRTPVNPFSFDGPGLVISAVPHEFAGQRYVSGVITTYRKFSQMYGYFEARMKMPNGAGSWPTFWLMPASNTWPPEIDVAEMTGSDPFTLMTVVHDKVEDRKVASACYVATPDMSADFHTYGLLWTDNRLIWYFDGGRVCDLSTPSSLHVPMYMLLNLAIGSGGWTGAPSELTEFPQRLRVQYVRAYARQSRR